jgi:hypothetical protein
VVSVMEDTAMANPLLPDELWERIEPLLPPLPPHPKAATLGRVTGRRSQAFCSFCGRGFRGNSCR